MRENALYRTVRDIQDVHTQRDGRTMLICPLTEMAEHNNKMIYLGNTDCSDSVGRALDWGSKGC